MIGSDALKLGYLEFHSRTGKPPQDYPLQLGLNTIGSTVSSNIRIKGFTDKPNSQFCVIEVLDNGVAILDTKMKDSVDLNGSKMNKVQILKNKDKLVVAGKEFSYVNDFLVPAVFKDSIKTMKRQSVMPSFKVKNVSKFPIISKSVIARRSLSATKARKAMCRRLCSSALADRKKVDEWQSIDTPIFTGRPLQPSTSMKKVSDLSMVVRRSLFLKNKNDTSMKRESTKSFTSTLMLDDSLSTSFEEALQVPSPRGVKRNRESSTGSLARFNKRRKHEDRLVLNLSISRGDSFFDESSGSSTDNTVQDSPLAIALYKLLADSNSESSLQGVKKLLKTPKGQESPLNDLSDVRDVKSILKTPKDQNSPRNDLTDVKGVKRILRTPKVQNLPLNDLTDVRGVKKFLRTPKVQKSPVNDLTVHVEGVKKLLASPKVQKSPVNDLSNVEGVKKFLKTPKVQKSPLNDLTNVGGVKKLLKTPKIQKSPLNDLTDVRGLKKFLRTPKVQKSPHNDLTDVRGVKKTLRTPKIQKSPRNDLTDVKGVKKLMKTPKIQNEPFNDLSDFEGVKELMETSKREKKKAKKVQKSPLNDLTDVRGVKKLMKTPKVQKSPLNDLSDVRGVKKLMIGQKEPLDDLSDLDGVKELLDTPKVMDLNEEKRTKKVQKSPLNDLRDIKGVKSLLKTPKVQKSPLNDLSDVRGVKKLIQSPKTQKGPLNDLSNFEGVEELLNSPRVIDLNDGKRAKKVQKSPMNDLRDIKGVKKLLKKSPKVQRSPLNDLSDVRGVKKLMQSPKTLKEPLNDLSDLEGVKELMDSPKINQSLNVTLEEVYNELLHSSAVHNSTGAAVKQSATSPKVQKSKGRQRKVATPIKTPDRKQSLSESVEVSQRGRRIRRKRFDDDFEVESPRQKLFAKEIPQKRNLRSRKKADENEKQVSVNLNVDSSNLKKSEEVEMPPKRAVRGRKKAVAEQPRDDGHVENEEVVAEKRGRRKKNAAEAVQEKSSEVDNPNLEMEVAQKRSVRGRGKKIEVETATPEKRGRRKKKEVPEEAKTEELVPDESTEQRSVRGKHKNEGATNNEKTENEVPQKRAGRGQKKKAEEAVQVEENAADEPVEEKGRRGRRKNEKIEDEVPPKRSGRGQKKVVEGESPKQGKKQTRGRKRTVVEAINDDGVKDDQQSLDGGTKGKRTRRGKAIVNESSQQDTVDNVQKTHNTRRGRK